MYGDIKFIKVVAGPAAGTAGTATATGKSDFAIEGEIVSLDVKYSGVTAPATGDIVVRTAGAGDTVQQTLYTKTDTPVNIHTVPKVAVHDNGGSAIANQYGSPYICDQVEVVISQMDVGTIATATIGVRTD